MSEPMTAPVTELVLAFVQPAIPSKAFCQKVPPHAIAQTEGLTAQTIFGAKDLRPATT